MAEFRRRPAVCSCRQTLRTLHGTQWRCLVATLHLPVQPFPCERDMLHTAICTHRILVSSNRKSVSYINLAKVSYQDLKYCCNASNSSEEASLGNVAAHLLFAVRCGPGDALGSDCLLRCL